MNKAQSQRKEQYYKAKDDFLQMELESEIKALTDKIARFKITGQTVLAALEYELIPLQQRVNALMQSIENYKSNKQ